MSKKNKTKTPIKAAAKKKGRVRTPSRKKAAAAAAGDDDDGDTEKDDDAKDDDSKQVADGMAARLEQELQQERARALAVADDDGKVDNDKDDNKKDDDRKDGDDGQALVTQLAAMMEVMAKLPPSMLAAASKMLPPCSASKKLPPGSVAGSDFSDVSESDGEGTRSVLPTRTVADSGSSKRLRGGLDRLGNRTSGLRRTHAAEMSDDEMARVERALKTGAKVPSFSRARGHRFGRPTSLVMDVLVDEGELPPSGDADRTMASMFEMLRSKSAKDARKEVKEYKTFGAWFARYSEMGFLSRERLHEDPDTYWCFDWHLKCMLYITAEYDWATASAYHARVVKRWDRLDLEAMAYGDDAACGDWEAALHADSLYAVQLKSKAKADKYDKTDWYCRACGKYFPKSANHSSSCPKSTATKNPAPQSGGGKPRP